MEGGDGLIISGQGRHVLRFLLQGLAVGPVLPDPAVVLPILEVPRLALDHLGVGGPIKREALAVLCSGLVVLRGRGLDVRVLRRLLGERVRLVLERNREPVVLEDLLPALEGRLQVPDLLLHVGVGDILQARPVVLDRRREVFLLLLLELLAPLELPGLDGGLVREVASLGTARRIEMLPPRRNALVVGLRLLGPRHDHCAPLFQLLVGRLQRDGLVGRLQCVVQRIDRHRLLVLGRPAHPGDQLLEPLVLREGLAPKLRCLPVLRLGAVEHIAGIGEPLVVLLEGPGVVVGLHLLASGLQDRNLAVLPGLPLLRPVLLLLELLLRVGIELRRGPPRRRHGQRLVEVLLLVGRAHLVDLVAHLGVVLVPARPQLLVGLLDRRVIAVGIRGDDQLLLGIGKPVLVHQLLRLADLLVDRLLLLAKRIGRCGRILVGRVELRRLLGVLDRPVVVALAGLRLGAGKLVGDVLLVLVLLRPEQLLRLDDGRVLGMEIPGRRELLLGLVETVFRDELLRLFQLLHDRLLLAAPFLRQALRLGVLRVEACGLVGQGDGLVELALGHQALGLLQLVAGFLGLLRAVEILLRDADGHRTGGLADLVAVAVGDLEHNGVRPRLAAVHLDLVARAGHAAAARRIDRPAVPRAGERRGDRGLHEHVVVDGELLVAHVHEAGTGTPQLGVALPDLRLGAKVAGLADRDGVALGVDGGIRLAEVAPVLLRLGVDGDRHGLGVLRLEGIGALIGDVRLGSRVGRITLDLPPEGDEVVAHGGFLVHREDHLLADERLLLADAQLELRADRLDGDLSRLADGHRAAVNLLEDGHPDGCRAQLLEGSPVARLRATLRFIGRVLWVAEQGVGVVLPEVREAPGGRLVPGENLG